MHARVGVTSGFASGMGAAKTDAVDSKQNSARDKRMIPGGR